MVAEEGNKPFAPSTELSLTDLCPALPHSAKSFEPGPLRWSQVTDRSRLGL